MSSTPLCQGRTWVPLPPCLVPDRCGGESGGAPTRTDDATRHTGPAGSPTKTLDVWGVGGPLTSKFLSGMKSTPVVSGVCGTGVDRSQRGVPYLHVGSQGARMAREELRGVRPS